MHSPLCFPLFISLISLIVRASGSPVFDPSGHLICRATDIAIVRRTISDETYFCKWWLSDTRTRTPFLEFSSEEVTELCKCIVLLPTKKPTTKQTVTKQRTTTQMKTVTKQKTATEQRTVTRPKTMTKLKTVTKQSRAESTALNELENRQTVAPCRAEMSVQFTEPYHFCVFYNACPRTTSPFAKYSARELVKLCKCVEGGAVPASSSKTSSMNLFISTTKVLSTLPSKTSSEIMSRSSSGSKTSVAVSLIKTAPKTSSRATSKATSKSSTVSTSTTRPSFKSISRSSSKAISKTSSRHPSPTSLFSSETFTKSSSKLKQSTFSGTSTTSKGSSSLMSKSIASTSKFPSSSPLASLPRVVSSSALKSSIVLSSSLSTLRSSVVSESSASASISASISGFSTIVIPSPTAQSSSSETQILSSTSESPSSTTKSSIPSITLETSSSPYFSNTTSLTGSETSTTTGTSTSFEASSSPTTSTESIPPGRIYAKGGIVDGQFLARDIDSYIPNFSASPNRYVSCTLQSDRSLLCNNYIAKILGSGFFFQLRDTGIKLQCDRAADGLLTCDPIKFGKNTYYGPFGTCPFGATAGNYLNYLDATGLEGCTSIDGLYLS